MPRPYRRPAACMLAALFTVCALVIGCSSPHALPDIEPGFYSGPVLDLDASHAQYVVIAHAPTPGWVVGLDRVAEQYRHEAVFITMHRPNPAFMYPQMEVEQRIATTVGTGGAVKVYVRLLSPGDDESSRPYVLAASSEASAPPAPAPRATTGSVPPASPGKP